MTTYIINATEGTTPGQAREQAQAIIHDLETADYPPGQGVRFTEVHPDDVPAWERNCPCTFTIYVIQAPGAEPYVLAWQRAYEFNNYEPRILGPEFHKDPYPVRKDLPL